ncbi:hypothetical protein [Amycolatopsis sp. cmx-4-54]|uniref:hypothetical protein n=1 Tax=Amycolatopsis sp. cmx-4-54 TaxID=2790936 RepID=UPI003979F51E
MSDLTALGHAGTLAQARSVLDAIRADEWLDEGVTVEDIRLGAYLHGGYDDLALIAQARQAYGFSGRQTDLRAEIAQDLVDRHLTDIGLIARRLLEHRTLTDAQLRACVPALPLVR